MSSRIERPPGWRSLTAKLLLVPMGRGIDHGHTADAEEAIEPVFAAKDGAHALLRTGDHLTIG